MGNLVNWHSIDAWPDLVWNVSCQIKAMNGRLHFCDFLSLHYLKYFFFMLTLKGGHVLYLRFGIFSFIIII